LKSQNWYQKGLRELSSDVRCVEDWAVRKVPAIELVILSSR
jgi:hypothetical protein